MSNTTERIRELAAKGHGAQSIAHELGLSRQRIYQLATKHGIPLPARTWPMRPARPSVPVARVVTGGIVGPLTHSVVGSISELLAAADLMARGWQVYRPMNPTRGHDLIAVKGERIITVEVRSTRRNAAGNVVIPTKAGCPSTHYALVVTGEPVSYKPSID